MRVRALAVGERDVAGGARPDRENRLRAVAAGHVHQGSGADRCGRRVQGTARHSPQLFARRRVVSLHGAGAVRDQLGALRADVDRWRGERREQVARRPPDLVARVDIEGGDERALLLIRLHDHHVLPDDRRTGGTPLIGVVVGGARIQGAEVAVPEHVPAKVVAEQVAGGDQHHDVLAVGRRRCRRVAVLRVALHLRIAARHLPHPDHPAASTIDRVDEPRVARPVGPAVLAPVGPIAKDRIGILAHGRRQEDSVAPDDRARVPEPRDRGAPQHVESGLRIPRGRRILTVGDSGGEGPAERRPVESLRRLPGPGGQGGDGKQTGAAQKNGP